VLLTHILVLLLQVVSIHTLRYYNFLTVQDPYLHETRFCLSFTNEKGETKVVKTHHELINEIDRYKELRNKEAVDDAKPQDAAVYQKCVDQLEKLKPLLPTVGELESQLAVAEEEMRAAVDNQDIDDEVKFHKDVINLKKKLKDENDAVADRDISSSFRQNYFK
jgi:hypothetical protein